jgi:hypothetical protein
LLAVVVGCGALTHYWLEEDFKFAAFLSILNLFIAYSSLKPKVQAPKTISAEKTSTPKPQTPKKRD